MFTLDFKYNLQILLNAIYIEEQEKNMLFVEQFINPQSSRRTKIPLSLLSNAAPDYFGTETTGCLLSCLDN